MSNTQISEVLAQRGKRYGDFSNHSQVAQHLQDALRLAGEKVQGEGWNRLSAVQKQALSVICDKLARIVSGDPNYDDNWIDIQGYAKLAQDRLPKQGELFDVDSPPQYSTGNSIRARNDYPGCFIQPVHENDVRTKYEGYADFRTAITGDCSRATTTACGVEPRGYPVGYPESSHQGF